MVTPKEECLDALVEAAEILGRSPTKAQYEELGLSPASGTIIRVMGGWNEAKVAVQLETYERGEFGGTPVKPKPDWVDVPDDVEWDELNPQQRWYYKNRGWRIAVKEKRKNEIRRWLFDYKRDNCRCERCGEAHPLSLDFHHVGEKRMGVSRMANRGCSKKSILDEIDSCIVLCANCHRKEHFDEPHPSTSSQD